MGTGDGAGRESSESDEEDEDDEDEEEEESVTGLPEKWKVIKF